MRLKDTLLGVPPCVTGLLKAMSILPQISGDDPACGDVFLQARIPTAPQGVSQGLASAAQQALAQSPARPQTR